MEITEAQKEAEKIFGEYAEVRFNLDEKLFEVGEILGGYFMIWGKGDSWGKALENAIERYNKENE